MYFVIIIRDAFSPMRLFDCMPKHGFCRLCLSWLCRAAVRALQKRAMWEMSILLWKYIPLLKLVGTIRDFSWIFLFLLLLKCPFCWSVNERAGWWCCWSLRTSGVVSGFHLHPIRIYRSANVHTLYAVLISALTWIFCISVSHAYQEPYRLRVAETVQILF